MKGKIEQRKAVVIMALMVIMLTTVICIVMIPEYSRMQMAIGETEVSGIALASGTELENGDVLETLQQLNDEISRYKFYSECLLGVSCVCILIAIFAVALLIKELVYLKKKGKATEDKSGALVKCEIANGKVAHPENDGDANTPTENGGGVNKLTGEEDCAANAGDGEKSSEIITGQSILEEWQKLKDCHSELTKRYDELIKNFVDNVKNAENSADDNSGDMISVSREEWIKRNEEDIKLGNGIQSVEAMLNDGLKMIQTYAQNEIDNEVKTVSNIAISQLRNSLSTLRDNMAEYRPEEGTEFDIYEMKDVTDTAGGTPGAVKEVKTPGRRVGNYVVEPAEVIRYVEAEEKETMDEEGFNQEGKEGQDEGEHVFDNIAIGLPTMSCGVLTAALQVTEEEKPKKSCGKHEKKGKQDDKKKQSKKRGKRCKKSDSTNKAE